MDFLHNDDIISPHGVGGGAFGGGRSSSSRDPLASLPTTNFSSSSIHPSISAASAARCSGGIISTLSSSFGSMGLGWGAHASTVVGSPSGGLGNHLASVVTSSLNRWHVTMEHAPTRVLAATSMIDDAYTQCISWGSRHIGILLDSQVLLYDAANPSLFWVSKLEDGDANNSSPPSSHTHLRQTTTSSAARLTAVAVGAIHSEDEVLVGDSTGRIRIMEGVPGSSEGRVVSTYRLSSSDSYMMSPSLEADGRRGTEGSIHHAAAIASNKSALFDTTTRSASCADVTVHHPFLYLVGSASGSASLIDTRVQGGVVACTPPAPFHAGSIAHSSRRPSPSTVLPCAGDRILSVSWNCSGSMFALGTNSTGVSVWSASKMSAPLQVLPCRGPISMMSSGDDYCLSNGSDVTGDRVSAGGVLGDHGGVNVGGDVSGQRDYIRNEAVLSMQHAAVRALSFHPTDPFELSYGGGLGDGCIYTVNVASGRRRYEVATGAQVTQLRYSPCGSHLVTSHGWRREDIPRLPAAATGVHSASSPRSSSSTPLGANDGNLNAWGGAPEGPCSRKRFCVAVWSRGKHKKSPSGVLMQQQQVQPAAVMGGVRHQFLRSPSRDSLEEYESVSGSESDNGGGDSSDDGGYSDDATRPLQLRIRLDGHLSRPLHMAVPRDGPHQGSVVTAAGGIDGTVRTWSIFATPSHREKQRSRSSVSPSSASTTTTTTTGAAAAFGGEEAPHDGGSGEDYGRSEWLGDTLR